MIACPITTAASKPAVVVASAEYGVSGPVRFEYPLVMNPIVLFNTGWMREYRGNSANDRIVNGGGNVIKEGTGWEVFNFLPVRGFCYGYVKPGGGDRLRLERIGGTSDAERVEHVTVVFTATRPKGGRVVVGWYKNAQVWRDRIQRPIHAGLDNEWYFAKARERDAVLLPPDERTFGVPRARKGAWGMGQSNVRYTDSADASAFRHKLMAYIGSPQKNRASKASPGSGRGWGGDPAIRAKVEREAVDLVVRHYKALGFETRSVEADRVGWDIEVRRDSVQFQVEVKGCSGTDRSVELTPNEYAAMNSHPETYRLAIVTSALSSQARRLSILEHNPVNGQWTDKEGRAATFRERTAASVSLAD